MSSPEIPKRDVLRFAVPLIDCLQQRLQSGHYIKHQDEAWWLFDNAGDGIVSGQTLTDMLCELLYMDHNLKTKAQIQ